MAGTIDLLQRCYTGIELRDDVLRLHPVLPVELGSLAFSIRYRGHLVHLEFTPELVRVSCGSSTRASRSPSTSAATAPCDQARRSTCHCPSRRSDGFAPGVGRGLLS